MRVDDLSAPCRREVGEGNIAATAISTRIAMARARGPRPSDRATSHLAREYHVLKALCRYPFVH